ncbi:MAG TPA: ATP-binding protein [Patescibacteria group bacterium]|nr:ATP-binding protein [Patescibacteria group bacterium]
MIRKVKFSNFYSFNKEQEISFLAKKKKTYDYYQSKTDDQITKIAGFIGGNASGKTNVMRFFSFLKFFVCRNINDEFPLMPGIAFKTFFGNDKLSNFYVEFEHNNNVFFYDFSIKKDIITKESLYIKAIQAGSKKIKIFSRQLSTIDSLNENYFKNISISALPKIREDVSFIAFIKKSTYSVDIINSVYDYFLGFKTNINERGEINHVMHQIDALKVYLSDSELKKEVENFIRHFDIGLNSFEIKEDVREKGFSITVQGVHSTKTENNKLDFGYESRGTKSLFFVMANILSALKNNNVVIIDELETGFHPEALNKLIGYFIDEDKNKKAQLIFSSHSLGFMNKLDMHQIYLVEKNNKCESSVFRLNQVEGIRPDENFLSKYMTGSYGAFPKIKV